VLLVQVQALSLVMKKIKKTADIKHSKFNTLFMISGAGSLTRHRRFFCL
jgi:hypothetical protein